MDPRNVLFKPKCIDFGHLWLLIYGHLWLFFYKIYTFLFEYNTVDYLTHFFCLCFHFGSKMSHSNKRIRLYRKVPICGHSLYNLYVFCWIQHGCLANRDFALDPSSNVIKRLWCIFQWKSNLIALSRSALGQTLMVNQLVDMEWKFGGKDLHYLFSN